MYLEDATLTLMLGLDVDEDNRFLVYASSPVFNKDAKKKTEEFYDIRPISVRRSKIDFDTISTGIPSAGKIQSILIGKKLLEQENWFSLLDPLFRNAESTVTSYVIVVDGPVAEITHFHPEDKPPLPMLLVKLITSTAQKNATLDTTLQEFHRQMYDKSMTPSLPLLRKDRDLIAMGAALLNEQGKYVTSLNLQETILLRILQRDISHIASYTMTAKELQTGPPNPIVKSKLSIDILKSKAHIWTTYQGGKFGFDIRFKMRTRLTERTFPFRMLAHEQQLQQQIESILERDLTALIHKIQKNRIDPFGLGIFAQAYQYHAWKKVQDDWGKALSEADIKVTVKMEMTDSGVLQ